LLRQQRALARGAKGTADFYVRLNNSTRLLNTAEALEYVRSRWRQRASVPPRAHVVKRNAALLLLSRA
jgi:hypothetical protein